MGKAMIIGCGGVAERSHSQMLSEQRCFFRDLYCKPYCFQV